MKILINYTDSENIQTQIEFDNLDDAYSFTFDFECSQIEILGEGVYTVDDFQKYISNN